MIDTGKVMRFDEFRGYGFIAPDSGGEDVFVHANEVGDDKWSLAPGVPVEFEAMESGRGRKALSVRVLRDDATGAPTPATNGAGQAPSAPVSTAPAGDADADDDTCDVLSRRDLLHEVTETLLNGGVPELKAAQVVEIRNRMLALAQSHGWVDS